MDKHAILIDELIVKMINIYEDLSNVPRDYGVEEKIYPADIHMIEFIGANPEHNTTELSELTGLTKGTISKRLSRLEKEGFVEYYQHEGNNKEKFYRLTTKGRSAFEGHYKFHEVKGKLLHEELSKYTEGEKKLIIDFLNKYNEYLKNVYD